MVATKEQRDRYKQKHPDRVRASRRAWDKANPEAVREKTRRHHKAHRPDLREYERKDYRANPDGRKRRNRERKRFDRYRLTNAAYVEMARQQGGLCAICHRFPSGAGPDAVLHVDHDHATGKVRALLCRPCNMGLGQFRDSPLLLRLAVEYLERHADAEEIA